jgi:prolyl-tRNA editing enzyme YbaK/EbsC (Cys-tRNA(Pro) deacylase)
MSRTAEPPCGASVERVRAEAARLGLNIEIVRLAEGTRTAAEAARACGCGVAQIVKSIVFRVVDSDRHVLFLTGGDARVDPAKAAALVGDALEKADAASIRAHTGFAIGGVSPLGHLVPIATWWDPGLLEHPVIWAAAGTPNHVFAVEPARLRAAIRAPLGDFTAVSPPSGSTCSRASKDPGY